jgi:hypothetical protein
LRLDQAPNVARNGTLSRPSLNAARMRYRRQLGRGHLRELRLRLVAAANAIYLRQGSSPWTSLPDHVYRLGLGHVLREKTTIRNGRVLESNYTDYEVTRMSDVPNIKIKVVSTDNPSTGAGKDGVPVVTSLNWFGRRKQCRI